MRRISLLSLLLLLLLSTASLLRAQDFGDVDDTGVFGYTSIYYNPSTLEVSAYSETDLYGSGIYYYQAAVVLTSNGLEDFTESPNPNVTWVSAFLNYTGSAGQSYMAEGSHRAYITTKFLGGALNDPYDLEEWIGLGVLEPWQFPFTAYGEAGTYPEPEMTLGSTYDYAEVTVPQHCGDQRDTIITEYGTPPYSTGVSPACNVFTQSVSVPSVPGNQESITFQEINSGTYSWAIAPQYFINNLANLGVHSQYNITSAYRNPAKEYAVDMSVAAGKYYKNSRHLFGDAVDIATSSQAIWQNFQNWGTS